MPTSTSGTLTAGPFFLRAYTRPILKGSLLRATKLHSNTLKVTSSDQPLPQALPALDYKGLS